MDLSILFALVITVLFIILIVSTLQNKNKKSNGIVREEEVYYLRYPRRYRFRKFGEKKTLRKLRRGGLTGDENCGLVCKFCMDRGYDFCNDPDSVQGCDCETNTRVI